MNSEGKALNQWNSVKAEGQKDSPQKVTHGSQVRDREVVRVHSQPPQETADEVSNI